MGTYRRIEHPLFQAYDSNGDPLSGGLVYTYAAGTTTAKATYQEDDTENANPVVLDSTGRAEIYGTGYYKFILKTSAGVTIWTLDNIQGIGETSITDIGDWAGDLDAAITAISTTPTTLHIDSTATMLANVTVPATCAIVVLKGGTINQSTYALVINGPFDAGIFEVFTGTGAVTFGAGSCPELISEWWGENTIPGTTDLTAGLQYWLDSMYDSNLPGFLPKGRHLTGKLDYAGQSIRGVPGSGLYTATYYSSEMSSFAGKDSEDIFNYSVDSPANSNIFKRGTILRDLLFIVDDTTDAAASYTNRDGGGNAGIALDHLDGDTNSENSSDNFCFIRARLQNVAITSKSLDTNGKNSSIAFFQQGLIYDVTFDQLYLGRCEYGFWGYYPTSNETDIEYAPDSLKFNNCMIECMNPFRIYNSFASSINNMQVYGAATDDKGISIKKFTSSTRGSTYFWHISNLYQEIGHISGTGEIGEIEGQDHIFIGGDLIDRLTAQYYTWDADYCYVRGMRINNKTGEVSLKVTGDRNTFEDIITAYHERDWFSDTGTGNRISINDSAVVGTDPQSSRPIAQNTPRMTYPALVQTSHFASKLPSTPYYGNEDLFFWPSDIYWTIPATQPTITRDATVGGSGEYATMISPGGQYYFTQIGRVSLLAGYQVPLGRVRVYAMVKTATSNTTQNWNLDVNGAGTEIDDKDCLVTTSWSVIHFDADLTGLTKGHDVHIRAGAPTVNQAWSLAWVTIVPYEEHDLGAHVGRGWGVYDFAVNGGATGDHILGTLFDNAVITKAWYEGITDPTSGGSATIALGVETNDANGIITATAYDNAIFNPGWHDATPDGTATNFTTQTTAVRHVVFTIGTAALTAGKFKVYWEYSVGE